MSDDEVRAEWWAPAFDSDDAVASTGELSYRLEALAREPGLGELERRVLQALAGATSAMLSPGNWLEPFAPMWQFGSERSILPSDLDGAQVALLAELVPLIEQPALLARVADIAWFYGDRSNVALVDVAIDAYRATPLNPDAWFGDGREAWLRAFDLVARRGTAGHARRAEMANALVAYMLGAALDDRFMVADCAGVLRDHGRPDAAVTESVRAHLVGLAAEPAAPPDLARALELEAAAWFPAGDERNACLERAGRTYIAEADARVANDGDGAALVEGLLLENAVAMLRSLPKSYRTQRGIDTLLAKLRARLTHSRESAIESMMRIETDPIDLTEAVIEARARVSGITDCTEALVRFATLVAPMDADTTHASATSLVEGSISRLFPSSTLSADGRKVAALDGGIGASDAAIRAEVVRTVTIHAQLVVQGMILPAQQILTFEHAFDRNLLVRICAESPVVPERHSYLWGAGLALGLDGDYELAAAILAPQLEQMVRTLLKRNGAHTLFVDDESGVESEKGLNSLLDMPETAQALGAGMVMELKALLIDQQGPNVRNDVAHGLFNDFAARTYAPVYVWWLSLRLAVWPWWQMTRGTGSDTSATDDEQLETAAPEPQRGPAEPDGQEDADARPL